MKLSQEALEKMLWEQETLYNDGNGFYGFAVTYEGKQYDAGVKVPEADMPGGEDGINFDLAYSADFAPYVEAVESLLHQINNL